jgi:phosphoribosylcarboxyaminoimidazole (NCAIR) mutase
MAIGKAGAKNAGIFAAQLLSVNDKKLQAKLKKFRKDQTKKVVAKARKLKL